jgi:8-oxo-dGTP pyrophosphatase MutT (NUDIX family)
VFTVSHTRSRSPRTGQPHSFFRIDSTDWANIVPITPEGEVVMVRQYRHGADRVTLETPGGLVDAGETPAEAAARELLEETGYRAGEITPLGAVNPNPALFGNRLHAFVARDSVRVAQIQNEAIEETRVEVVTREQLRRFVRDGTVDHALVVAALYLLDLHEGRVGNAQKGS